MIGYQHDVQMFNSIYVENKDVKLESDLKPEIVHYPFRSEFPSEKIRENFVSGDLFYHELVQRYYNENAEFVYPILVPEGKKKYNSAIILLHGLNERSWKKYLPWANYLAINTKKPVILFPIAYHMNRSPKDWSDPRQMSMVSSSRKSDGLLKNSTFLNAAISTRLQYHPEQFIYSGLQSFFDISKLVKEVQSGSCDLFERESNIDLFAYSIGAFLAEILFLNNPEHQFSKSKLFMFCGGCTFDHMKGESKFIMDNKAFESLELLLQRRRLKHIRKKMIQFGIPSVDKAWEGLFMMMHNKNKRKKREKLLQVYGNRIFALGLEQDKVIVKSGIIETLKGRNKRLPTHVEIIDFPFEYSHEQPFPLTDEKQRPMVDKAFQIVFDKAVDFFGKESG